MKRSLRGVLFILLTAVISGFSVLVNSWGVKGIDATLYAGMKNILVGIVLVGAVVLARHVVILQRLAMRQWLQLSLVGLVGGSVPFILFFHGLQQASAASAGFIHKTMFVYVGLAAAVFLKEKISRQIWIGILALATGMFLLTQTADGFVFNNGDFLVLAATLLWSVEIVLSKKLLGALPVDIVAAARMFFGGTFIWIFLLMTGKGQLVTTLSGTGWLWVGITSAFLFAYVITFYHGLQRLPAHIATSLLALAAPITILLSVIWNGQGLTVTQITGTAVISFATLYMLVIITMKIKSRVHVLTADN